MPAPAPPNREPVIVLRQSPDWARQTYADLEGTRDFCRMIGRPETMIIDIVRLWDETFTKSFFQLRAEMKRISLRNFGAVAGASLLPVEALASSLDPGRWYLFTDDDDWFAPDVALALGAIDCSTWDAVVWGSVRFGAGVEPRPADGFFYTNNYAVSGRYLMEAPNRLEQCLQHHHAQPHFAERTNRLARLDRHLSVTNKHPASTLVLERALAGTLEGERLVALVQNWIEASSGTAWPDHLRWAEPYARTVVGLYTRLLGSHT